MELNTDLNLTVGRVQVLRLNRQGRLHEVIYGSHYGT